MTVKLADPESAAMGPEPAVATEQFSPNALIWRRMLRHRGFMSGAILVGILVLLAIFAPVLAAHDPFQQNLTLRMLPPFWVEGGLWEHPLGTDAVGRDYLSRLLYGARISLTVGIGAASIGCLVGVTLGVCAGYFGGKVDKAALYLLSCQLAMPSILFAMALIFLIGPSLVVVICVIGLLHWSMFLVVTRAAVMQIRELEYVAAARTVGSSHSQIIFHEILPNLQNQIIIVFTLEMGLAILAEASLSFLGVGIPYPQPSWGLMISGGKNALFFNPWLVFFPGVALFLLVLGANLLGDGLRDVTAVGGRN